jgi:hypothetical protein
MKRAALLIVSLLATSAFAAGESVSKVNGSIDIAAGQVAGAVSTVNGSVHVGANAKVGSVRSVNGGLHLGAGATAAAMSTVNGVIELGAAARITGDARSVNGAMTIPKGAEVSGAVGNVNGQITIDGGHVVGRLHTVAGSISVLNGARVDGGILVEKPGMSFSFTTPAPPRIVIGAGCIVTGTLKFEHEVKLYVSDQVKQIGTIEGATAIKFSGATPPG